MFIGFYYNVNAYDGKLIIICLSVDLSVCLAACQSLVSYVRRKEKAGRMLGERKSQILKHLKIKLVCFFALLFNTIRQCAPMGVCMCICICVFLLVLFVCTTCACLFVYLCVFGSVCAKLCVYVLYVFCVFVRSCLCTCVYFFVDRGRKQIRVKTYVIN